MLDNLFLECLHVCLICDCVCVMNAMYVCMYVCVCDVGMSFFVDESFVELMDLLCSCGWYCLC